MLKKVIGNIILMCGIALLPIWNALAANSIKVVGVYTKEQEVSIYVKGLSSEIIGTECQIGTKTGQKISYENVIDMENAPKTLIMIDNSLSITEENRKKIKDFLLELVDDKEKNELIAIEAFSEESKEIIGYTDDRKALEEAIESITYQDQETYLTDVLYEILEEEHLGTEDCYKKIIIISDGVDSKAIGYTKDELYALIKEKSYPIYSLGCIYKENNEELENMFAISRITGAKEFLLDDEENTDDVVDAITEDNYVIRFQVMPEAIDMDGSSKNVLLVIQTDAGEQKIEASVKMPLQAIVEEDREEDTEVIPEPILEVESEIIESEEYTFSILYVGIGVVVIAAVIIVLLLLKKKYSTSRQNEFEILAEDIDFHENIPAGNNDKTIALNEDEGRTQLIWGDAVKQYNLCLTDMTNSARSFQIPLKGSVIIGRKQGEANLVIDYDKSVSKRHCQVTERNGKFYVKDLQSSNGTLLDGTRILTEREIYSGCILTLGRLKVKVEIR